MIRLAPRATLLVAFSLLASACAKSGAVSATDRSNVQGELAVLDDPPIVNPLPTPPSSRRHVLVGSRWLLRSIASRNIVPPRIIVGPPCAWLLDDCDSRTTFEKLPSGEIRMSTEVRRHDGVIVRTFSSDLRPDDETRWLFKEDGEVDGQGLFRMLLIGKRGTWALSADEEKLILNPNRPDYLILRIESFGPQSLKLLLFEFGEYQITGETEIEFVRRW
jgi:hypothetical protein